LLHKTFFVDMDQAKVRQTVWQTFLIEVQHLIGVQLPWRISLFQK